MICPWQIEAKAARFLAFLHGYSVFLGPLLGGKQFSVTSCLWPSLIRVATLVLLSDFWLIRKAKGFNIYNLYKPGGLYWYTAGVNPRAIVAFVGGVTPLLPGLIEAINPQIRGISEGILDFYTLAWIDGVVVSR